MQVRGPSGSRGIGTAFAALCLFVKVDLRADSSRALLPRRCELCLCEYCLCAKQWLLCCRWRCLKRRERLSPSSPSAVCLILKALHPVGQHE